MAHPLPNQSNSCTSQNNRLSESGRFAQVPGMLSKAEKEYLYELASKEITGAGAVVEVGSWLGSSACFIAAGLATAGHLVPFTCYDRFSADPVEVIKAEKQGVFLHKEQDTLPVFHQMTEGIYPGLTAVKTELSRICWHGGPVELLHLDAPKKAHEFIRMLGIFGDHFICGRSVVVLQDFIFPKAYALVLITASLGGAWEWLAIPDPDKCMVSFRVIRKTPDMKDIRIFEMSDAEAEQLWRTMAVRIPGRRRQAYFNMGLAKYFYDKGSFKQAERVAAENLEDLTPERRQSISRSCPNLWAYLHKNKISRFFSRLMK